MPVTITSKLNYWQMRAKFHGDELDLLKWLEEHDRVEGWTIREISKELGWESGRVSARLNPLIYPKEPEDIQLVFRSPIKRYCTITKILVYSHRAICCDAQGRFF